MIKLPITDKELDIIIESLKRFKPELYAKLWSHKINFLNKGK
jgi:hypothetical protein